MACSDVYFSVNLMLGKRTIEADFKQIIGLGLKTKCKNWSSFRFLSLIIIIIIIIIIILILIIIILILLNSKTQCYSTICKFIATPGIDF